MLLVNPPAHDFHVVYFHCAVTLGNELEGYIRLRATVLHVGRGLGCSANNMGPGGFHGVGHFVAAACLRRLAPEIQFSKDKGHRAIESLVAYSRFRFSEPYVRNAALQSFAVPMNTAKHRYIAKALEGFVSISDCSLALS